MLGRVPQPKTEPAPTAAVRPGQRIDLSDPEDCTRWACHFDVTDALLREAVKAVGTMSDEVRRFLGRQRPQDRADL